MRDAGDDVEGRQHRMDRVVVDPDHLTVIDYKTGPEAREEHLRKIRSYSRILEGAYAGRRFEARRIL